MLEFNIDKLLEIFPEIAHEVGNKFNYFTRHHESALVPIMHLVIKKAFEDVENNPAAWGVTDFTTANVPQVIRILAINGSILKIDKGITKWYNEECTNFLSFNDSLYIYGKENACAEFLEKFAQFAKTINQNALMLEAKDLILSSGILPVCPEWKELFNL